VQQPISAITLTIDPNDEEIRTMQNLIPLILVGLFGYLIFSRKGGMGCCGSHGGHKQNQNQKENMDRSSHEDIGDVIDLHKDDYTILPTKDD
jgi:hypothetical protein